MAFEIFKIHYGSQTLNSFIESLYIHGVLCECGIEPVQLNWFRSTVRLYNSFIHCNSPLLQKVFHADIDRQKQNYVNSENSLHQFRILTSVSGILLAGLHT
eukprot:1138302-Pelagomonas_calceolata.AAC.1